MKRTNSLVRVLLALVMTLACAMPAFATESDPSITINNSNAAVSMVGHTYTAYKVFGLERDDTTAYTVAKGFEAFFSEKGAGTGAEAAAYVQAQGENMQAFAAELLAYTQDQGPDSFDSVTTAAATAETITIDLTTGLGYYLVADNGAEGGNVQQAVVAALALTSTNSDQGITLKADAPSIEKQIVVGETAVSANSAAIGDTVDYRLTSKVPDMTGYTKYFFLIKDTISKGLTFQNDVAVTVGEKTLTAGSDYTVDLTENGFEIVFHNFVEHTAGAAIAVTYSAVLNETAVIGNAGNPNDVILTYSNNPTVKDDGRPDHPDRPSLSGVGDATGETPKHTAVTYVTGLSLTKTDSKENRLTGAKFRLEGERVNQVVVYRDVYTEDAVGAYVKLENGDYREATSEDTGARYAKSTEREVQTSAETVKITATVGTDGVLSLNGLAEGTYTLTELVAPDGYNLLTEPIILAITCEEPDTLTTGAEACVWTYQVGAGEAQTAEDGVVGISVVNLTGSELPETGGIGTTVFTVLGILLMLGAAVVLVTRRKMAARED